jgi:rod shape-determining protein MreD
VSTVNDSNLADRVQVTHAERRGRRRRASRERPEGAREVAIEVGRLAAMLIGTVLLQTTIAPHLRILGATPDFALLAVVCVGLLRGSETGAIFGFLTGVCIAVAVFDPVGLSSFALVIVGYVAGRYAETADTMSGWTPIIVVVAGTFIAELLAILMQFLLDRQVPLGFVITRVVLPRLVLNSLLAAPAYVLARLWMREGVRHDQA